VVVSPLRPRGQQNGKETVPPGTYQAVCVDVIDLGVRKTQWKPEGVDMFSLRFQVVMSDGKRKLIDRGFAMSFAETSSISKAMATWGVSRRNLLDDQGIDLEKFIGLSATVVVRLNDQGYSQISSILPSTIAGSPTPLNYVRPTEVDF
jgi:hypothetical protein